MIRFISLSLFSILLVGCATSQQAPVIDRTPAGKSSVKAAESDWRPDLYTVKRGDTLYSIGLEHGYDYKEIAQANNIPVPYTIYVGQQLKLKQAPQNGTSPAPAPAPLAQAEPAGVVITPLDLGGSPVDSSTIDGSAAVQGDSSTTTEQLQLISAPKALREPYSEQALNSPPIVQTQAAPTPAVPPVVAPPANTTEPAKDTPAATTSEPVANNAGIAWSWPTTGKLLTGFSDVGSAKGIDIGGTTGQTIKAAAPGKVIYSGSDLRGYGKLVIVKHNADFLSVYAHNSKILVKEGDQVARGQKIAEMGDTDTDKTKLHFEIRRQGKSVDPASYLPANPG